MNKPGCFVHSIFDIYSPDVDAGCVDGRLLKAVAEPYTAGRLRAAWWVLTGRAYAILWPHTGDLELAAGLPQRYRRRAANSLEQ